MRLPHLDRDERETEADPIAGRGRGRLRFPEVRIFAHRTNSAANLPVVSTEVGWRLLRFLTMTPLVMGGSETVNLIVLCIVVAVIGRCERRGFDDYGLALRFALKKNFWVGAVTGFLTISSTLLGMFLLHGFRVNNLAIHGTQIVSSLVGWGVAFLHVGMFAPVI